MSARILVVDDVPENVQLLEAVLAPEGYEIVAAGDGTTALELAHSAKPELVLLDATRRSSSTSRWSLQASSR